MCFVRAKGAISGSSDSAGPLPFEPRLRPGEDFIAQDAITLELANLKMSQPESTWTSNLWPTSTLGYQLEITQPGFAKDGINLSPTPPKFPGCKACGGTVWHIYTNTKTPKTGESKEAKFGNSLKTIS